MIHELRIYTAKPGMAAEMAKNSGSVAREIRGTHRAPSWNRC